ncbi:MAG: type 4a pilus biogenesis protein PilO [Nitrospirae bacterium]|nr:type 4a pilus biogenesis protein PilO [Nitrospirota bacterium]
MALKLKIDFGTMPPAAKAVLSILPALIISVLVIMFVIVPKNKEIKRLNAEITKQENQIAVDQVKAVRLAALKVENEKLKKRLEELKLQLPEEKEVSSLLKQVSDLGIRSGLKIVSWKPEAKKDHPSGIIYEIPVAVEMSGSYHNLGIFFSGLTKFNRIVNIADIKIGDPKPQRTEAAVKITFKATTFSGIPEKEAMEKDAAAAKGMKK